MLDQKFFKQALLIRKTEDTFLDLFKQGKMNGTVHTSNGQEFSAVAFCNALNRDDFIYSNHRCHGHYLAHTADLYGLIAELMGKETGTSGGIGSSQHLVNNYFFSNGVQGSIVPVAAGLAMSCKKKKNNKVVSVFIGDGTLGEGVIYETFNLASLYGLPLLIVCEDNKYAQTTTQEDNLAGDIVTRAEAFGIQTFSSNTWELDDLFSNSQESVDYVRKNSKPCFHLVETYRLNPHSKGDDFRDEEELKKFISIDPLNVYENENPAEFNQILEKVNSQISEVLNQIKEDHEMEPDFYFNDFKEKKLNNEKALIPIEKSKYRVVENINKFFDDAMSADEKILFIGEDLLSPYGGAFKVSQNLSEKYPNQVITTPISELGITGLANGLAIGGQKPFLEIMFGDFMSLCFDQIINTASKVYHMYNKKVSCPVVIRAPMGGGRGYGPTHSQTLDKFFAGIDNVRLLALNSFFEPEIIYKSILRNETHPVIVIENKIDYGRFVGDKNNSQYSIQRTDDDYPIVECKPNFSEPTLTLVSYGGIASDVFNSLNDIFIETEMIPELFVLSQLNPLGLDRIFDAIESSKRVIFIEEGSSNFGIGAEVISRIAEQLVGVDLEIIKRIGALPVPIPSARGLENAMLPNGNITNRIVKELEL